MYCAPFWYDSTKTAMKNLKVAYNNSLRRLLGLPSSLSARILHRVPPPPPATSGPKFSNSENCCGSENAMSPKIFWDMEGHRGHFSSKNVFFFKKHILEKIHNKSHHFLIFRYAFCRYYCCNSEKLKISLKMCLYLPEKQP